MLRARLDAVTVPYTARRPAGSAPRAFRGDGDRGYHEIIVVISDPLKEDFRRNLR
jgi:hypothetical protein